MTVMQAKLMLIELQLLFNSNEQENCCYYSGKQSHLLCVLIGFLFSSIQSFLLSDYFKDKQIRGKIASFSSTWPLIWRNDDDDKCAFKLIHTPHVFFVVFSRLYQSKKGSCFMKRTRNKKETILCFSL